jgi:branched-chain amino acid transport system ATP-binding protein
MLSISKLDVAYGRARVLHGVSLDVPDRGVVAILGPNGAGKSTLLKTISGVLRATRGSIVYDGAEIGREDPAAIVRRGIVQVPEGRHIFADLTVEENLLLGAYGRRGRGADRREHIDALFPILRERLAQRGGTLSGGEQQMLAIARALMAGPRVLLLDEPSLGLAPIVVDRIYGAVATLCETGVAIVLVEQNAERARTICDRVIVLGNGHVRYDGPPAGCDAALRHAYLGVA